MNGQRIGAVIIEPTQGEGGARPFDPAYLRALREQCRELGVLVIADEVQAGVGRTGPFFSFEGSGLDPDIVCLSKSISGLGLPMALNLVRRELDAWSPGEFSGTFRGNNLAFATSAAMLETYWSDSNLEKGTELRGNMVHATLEELAEQLRRGNVQGSRQRPLARPRRGRHGPRHEHLEGGVRAPSHCRNLRRGRHDREDASAASSSKKTSSPTASPVSVTPSRRPRRSVERRRPIGEISSSPLMSEE